MQTASKDRLNQNQWISSNNSHKKVKLGQITLKQSHSSSEPKEILIIRPAGYQRKPLELGGGLSPSAKCGSSVRLSKG